MLGGSVWGLACKLLGGVAGKDGVLGFEFVSRWWCKRNGDAMDAMEEDVMILSEW